MICCLVNQLVLWCQQRLFSLLMMVLSFPIHRFFRKLLDPYNIWRSLALTLPSLLILLLSSWVSHASLTWLLLSASFATSKAYWTMSCFLVLNPILLILLPMWMPIRLAVQTLAIQRLVILFILALTWSLGALKSNLPLLIPVLTLSTAPFPMLV